MREKSSVEEIRERFDHDVERFSNLQSGQVSTVDAALSLELITEAAARLTPLATDLLDVETIRSKCFRNGRGFIARCST